MNNWKDGLTDDTLSVFKEVSNLECIKGLYLCGGTAVSLQLQHRKSEDLDFELIVANGERKELAVSSISKEIEFVFPNSRRDILGNDHFLYFIQDKVKLFFFKPANRVPVINTGFVHNNLKTVSKQDLLGMKLFRLFLLILFKGHNFTMKSDMRDQ